MSEQPKTKYVTKYVIVWCEKDCDNDIEDLGADTTLYDTEEEAKAQFEPTFKAMCNAQWVDYDEKDKSFETFEADKPMMVAHCNGDYYTFQICPVNCPVTCEA